MFARLCVRCVGVYSLAFGLALLALLARTPGGTECKAAAPVTTRPSDAAIRPGIHPPAEFDPADSVAALQVEWTSLDEFFRLYSKAEARDPASNPYGLALADMTTGLLKRDPADIKKAESLFAADATSTANPREKEADRLGSAYAEEILTGHYLPAKSADESVKPITYDRRPGPAKDFHTIILGRSAIHVGRHAKIKTQVDRVSRDWQLAWNVTSPPWAVSRDNLATWHEGSRIRQLMDLTDARVSCVWGTKVRRIGEKWYAPDFDGAPRFEVSPDKVCDYPTTIYLDDRTAILNDTHGISGIAWDCRDADLALGCGDHPGKMDAAYYLAEQGVNVYVPTDRYLGLLMGARTKGTIIGSGPTKAATSGDGAVIGDQPVAIDVDEPIVVSDSKAGYPLRYYDAPRRYFDALSAYCGKPLHVTAVEVTEYGNVDGCVAEARKIGAKVLGIRVKGQGSHDAVAAWLKEDKSRRAILFHTAAYPHGYKLFSEFPQQTSFGDINPQFE